MSLNLESPAEGVKTGLSPLTPVRERFSFPLDVRVLSNAEEKNLSEPIPQPRPARPATRRVPWHTLPAEAKAELNRRSWYRATVLFLVTVLSTLAVGADLHPTAGENARLLDGWLFSLPLLTILLCHEFGHYLLARRHAVQVSPPYFLPFPNLLGTLGAFIAFRSPLHNRRQLLDIGAAGPLAGFVPSVIARIIGLSLSELVPDPVRGSYLVFGDSLLTAGLQHLVLGPVSEGYSVVIHPVGFAGWVGLFVTMWNLFPFWQFDGGHITYALFGRRQWSFGPAAVIVVVGLGIAVNPWWLIAPLFMAAIFLVLTFVLRRLARAGPRPRAGLRETVNRIITFRFLRHFPVPNEEPLDRGRRIVGWICLIIFALTFLPDPIRIVTFG